MCIVHLITHKSFSIYLSYSTAERERERIFSFIFHIITSRSEEAEGERRGGEDKREREREREETREMKAKREEVIFSLVLILIGTLVCGTHALDVCDCSMNECSAGPVFTFMKSTESDSSAPASDSFTPSSDGPAPEADNDTMPTIGSSPLDDEPTGPVGYGPGGSLTVAPILCIDKTPASFIVNPCGVVAPHAHSNAYELNTVVQGKGVVCVQPSQAASENNPATQCAAVTQGDSFIFPKGLYHHWISTDSNKQFATITSFTAAPPNAALLLVSPTGSDSVDKSVGAGMIGTILTGGEPAPLGNYDDASSSEYAPMLTPLIGTFGDVNPNPGFPLFPAYDSDGSACSSLQSSSTDELTEQSGQLVSGAPKLATSDELDSGTYSVGADNIGGSVRLITNKAWSWLEEADLSLALYIFSYCGMLNMHIHSEADEWGTVIAGAGYVFQYGPNSPSNVTAVYVGAGEVYYIPEGNVHWFVNDSPDTQFVTITTWDESNLHLSFLWQYLSGIESDTPDILPLTLGKNFKGIQTSQENTNNDWPMLEGASPSGCGGDTACDTCGNTDFLKSFL